MLLLIIFCFCLFLTHSIRSVWRNHVVQYSPVLTATRPQNSSVRPLPSHLFSPLAPLCLVVVPGGHFTHSVWPYSCWKNPISQVEHRSSPSAE